MYLPRQEDRALNFEGVLTQLFNLSVYLLIEVRNQSWNEDIHADQRQNLVMRTKKTYENLIVVAYFAPKKDQEFR